MSVAFHRGYAFYRKRYVRIRGDKPYSVRPVHKLCQRSHGTRHFSIIQITNFKVQILEGLRAHARLLSHCGIGIPQHHPFRPGNAYLGMHTIAVYRLVYIHALSGHVGIFTRIVVSAKRYVSVHLFHSRLVPSELSASLLFSQLHEPCALNLGTYHVHERLSACAIYRRYKLLRDYILTVKYFYEHFLTRFYPARISHEVFCELP